MSKLCNKCECVNINGVRCHETGCPNQHEQIRLIDDGTLDTVFECGGCGEQFRFNFASAEADAEGIYEYEDFKFDCLHELQDTHICGESEV